MKQDANRKTVVFDIRNEIDSEVRQGASDPYKIAKKLAARVPPDVALEFVELHIVTLARTFFSDNRRGSFEVVTTENGKSVTAFDNTRWTTGRVWVPGNGYVKYRDLSADDCIAIAKDREARALGHQEEAKRFRSLASAMKKHGVKKAGELSEQVRVEVLK